MSRLTRRGKKNRDWVLINKICSKATGAFCPNAESCDQVGDRTCPYLEVLDRLCEYEDTNLEPSEIERLKAENERLRDTNEVLESDNYNLDMNLTHLSEELDRLKAEKGNKAKTELQNEPCAWCKGDWTDNFSVIDENFGQPLTYRHVKFCPMCGRKLRSPADEMEKNMKKELKENKNEK